MSFTGAHAGGCTVTRTAYRYLQINITAIDGSSTYTGLSTVKWFDGATEYPTSVMTTNSAPSPFVASATGEGGSDEAFRVFDGVFLTNWQFNSVSFPIYIRLDVGASNSFLPTSCKITSPETPDRVCKDFTLEGSNDESTWSVLKTLTGETSWGVRTERTFNIP